MRGGRFLQLVSAVAAAACCGAPAFAADRATAFPGTYANDVGTVTIRKARAGFDVQISTAEPTRGVWECDFEGVGKLDASGALVVVHKPEPDRDTATVTLKITLRRGVLSVNETRTTDIVDFCGYRGFLRGEYRRKVKQ